MTTISEAKTGLARWQPSEDWLATIIGLLIVLIIGSGLIGPGPQTVTLNAAAGETKAAQALPLSGWRISASIDGASAAIDNSSSALRAGSSTLITCRDGQLTSETLEGAPEGQPAPGAGSAQIVVINTCGQAVSVTYRTNAAIPWPVFNLFSR